MKKIVSFLPVFIFMSYSVFCQEENPYKSEKEKLRAEQRAYTAMMVNQGIANMRYVVEANYIAGRSGSRVPVPPSLNFVMVDSARVTFQLGSNTGGSGLNGVGGATLDGRILNYKVTEKTEKKTNSRSCFITFLAMTSVGTFDFSVNASDNGNADVSIKDNFGNNLRYFGILVPLEQSSVFKGVPTR